LLKEEADDLERKSTILDEAEKLSDKMVKDLDIAIMGNITSANR
jgi:hypothetical protein